MRALRFDRLKSVLCLGAHADDIEIGCGGTVLQWLRDRQDLQITWVVLSGDGKRRDEATRSAEAFLGGCRRSQIIVESFRDGYFPSQWASIKDCMAAVAAKIDPDLVLTHRLEDRHQDHRVVAELTWNHFRHQAILEYEVPKFEGDLTTPNAYVALDEISANRKVKLLLEHFHTQRSKSWFSASTFEGLMRIRGIESGHPTEWAEGFHARKMLFTI